MTCDVALNFVWAFVGLAGTAAVVFCPRSPLATGSQLCSAAIALVAAAALFSCISATDA